MKYLSIYPAYVCAFIYVYIFEKFVFFVLLYYSKYKISLKFDYLVPRATFVRRDI